MKKPIDYAVTPPSFQIMLTAEITPLKNYARKFTSDIEDIDDLVQDTLMKAISYFEKFENGSNMKAWLFTIMRNTFINNYRKAARKRNIIGAADNWLAEYIYIDTAKNEGEAKFVNKDILLALKKLPENLFLPFKMYTEGYKYHEIANQIGISIGTVKTRMHTGRNRLKKMLKEYEDI